MQKYSDAKVTKTFQLYFQGYSQTAIANKLIISQPTVSGYVSQFKLLAEQQGIMAAAEEYGVMDVVEPLYGLAVELKKNHASVEDALSCLKLKSVLDKSGFEDNDYGELIPTVKKLGDEDYLTYAIELSKLMDSTGLSYTEIVSEYKNISDQLTQAKKELQGTKAENSYYKQEAGKSKKQMQAVAQDLKLQNEALTKQTAVLKEKAKLQGEIETRIDKLMAEEATLEPKVKDLNTQYQNMLMTQDNVAALQAQEKSLQLTIALMQTQIKGLNTDIDTKNKKIADLKEVESEREDILKETAELKAKFEHDQRRWDIYQDFLGLVQSTSKHELKASVQALTILVESLPENTFAKDLDSLKNSVLQALTETKLPFLLKCQTCGASIATNKIKANGDYQCPKSRGSR